MSRKPRYIDADKLLEDIENLDATNDGFFHEVVHQILVSMEWLVGKQQPAEVKPVIHGKWERHYSRPGVYADLLWYCSACGEKTGYSWANMYSFCPYCGAEMKQGGENEDRADRR